MRKALIFLEICRPQETVQRTQAWSMVIFFFYVFVSILSELNAMYVLLAHCLPELVRNVASHTSSPLSPLLVLFVPFCHSIGDPFSLLPAKIPPNDFFLSRKGVSKLGGGVAEPAWLRDFLEKRLSAV